MHASVNAENLRIVGKNLSDKLASSTSIAERIPSEPKFYLDREHEPDEVVRSLRRDFRRLCGIETDDCAAPSWLEVQATLSFCYWLKKKRGESSKNHMELRRRTEDLLDYWMGKGLPDYVYWVYTHHPDLEQIPPRRRDVYSIFLVSRSG